MKPKRHLLEDESPPILHDKLITDILSQLPVKSLMRFRYRAIGTYNGLISFVGVPLGERKEGHHYVSDLDRSGDFDRFAIVSLDLGTETYAELPVPPLDMDSAIMPSLALLRDYLCICHVKNNTHFVLWQFGVDKNGNVLLLMEDEVVLYDLTENRVQRRVEIPIDIYCYGDKNYIESLVSPYGN
ncbi:F-box protein [Sesbania bispinosa]|nr:F-box protein [Sesbania bispinosa]